MSRVRIPSLAPFFPPPFLLRSFCRPDSCRRNHSQFGALHWPRGVIGCRHSMNVFFAAFFGGWQIVLILGLVLIFFGAKKLPELAKGLGQGIKEFKKATRDVIEDKKP